MFRRSELRSAFATAAKLLIGASVAGAIAAVSVFISNLLLRTLGFSQEQFVPLVFAISFLAALYSYFQVLARDINHGWLGRKFSTLMQTEIIDLLDGTSSVTVALRPSKPNLMSPEEASKHIDDLPPPRHTDRMLKIYVKFDTKLLAPDTEYRQENINLMLKLVSKFYREELKSEDGANPGMRLWLVLLDQGKFKCVLPGYFYDDLGELLRAPARMQEVHDSQHRAFSDQSPADVLKPDPSSNVLSSDYFLPIVNRSGKFLHVMEGSELLAELASAYAKWREEPIQKKAVASPKTKKRDIDESLSRSLSVRYWVPVGPVGAERNSKPIA
jgi:hypothetical protein